MGGVITSLKAEVVELARHATLRTLLELNPVKVRVLSSVLILSVFNETVMLSMMLLGISGVRDCGHIFFHCS